MISLYLRNEGLYYLPDYPESPNRENFQYELPYCKAVKKFERKVERSKANAIRVKNQDEVFNVLRKTVWKLQLTTQNASDFNISGRYLTCKIGDRNYAIPVDIGAVYFLPDGYKVEIIEPIGQYMAYCIHVSDPTALYGQTGVGGFLNHTCERLALISPLES
jgi:hypothetical protein